MLAIDLETLFARLLDLSDSAIKYGPFWVYAIIVAASFIENLFPPFPGECRETFRSGHYFDCFDNRFS